MNLCYNYNCTVEQLWGEYQVKNLNLKEEKYLDIEKLINESLSDKRMEDEKEDLVLEYLCQSVSKYDSYDVIKKRAENGEPYAYLKLASWHIDHAKNIKDYYIAYKYAYKAEQMGYVEANYLLGQLYYYGTGCQKNRYRARKCFKKFVEEVNPRYLLNETVIADAYLKLAEIEKEKKNFAKATYYFTKLHQFNQEFDSYIMDCENEINAGKKEDAHAIFTTTIGFFSFCACAFFLFRFLGNETLSLCHRIPDKCAIAVVDTIDIAEDTVPLSMQIVDTVYYYEVSEREFMEANYSQIPIVSVDASSVYISKVGNNYGPDNLIDQRSDTWWQEGARDSGVGQMITFHIPIDSSVQAFMIENGKATNLDEYKKNNRVACLTIKGDTDYKIPLCDEMGKKYFVLEKPISGSQFSIRIDSVYSGNTYNDTCISQLMIYE